MTDSRQLLLEYARNGSETAFRELVGRYLDLVYSVALRRVDGDTHRAQDVAQTVFMDLARMARSLSKEVMPGGWLHRHTCFVAANVMRGERRRQFRERQAVEMNALHDDAQTNLDLLAPVLDEVINELDETDRTAILLRFFEERNFQSVGEALGSTENTARMRVTRALDKLHLLLKRRGISTSAAALSAVLTAGVVQSAPVGLAAAISTSAILAGTAAQTSTLIAANKIIAMTTIQKIIVGGALAVAVGTGIYKAHQVSRLRDQMADARRQQAALTDQMGQLQRERDYEEKQLATRARVSAPTLPAPRVTLVAPTNTPVADLETNLQNRYMGKWPQLNAAQVADWLKANRTNSESLLAAYRTSKDPALLKEAMDKYPNDPQVAFEAILDPKLSPDEQRQWLNTFEQDDPGNALPNYLSAMNYFNAGQIDQGIQELSATAGKQFDDYTQDRIQDDEGAYASAGYSTAEAETIATQSLLIPQDTQIKQLGVDLVALADAYSQSGDPASAQATLQMAMNLGQNMISSQSTAPALISQNVGMAIEKMALNAMDPNSVYGSDGQTVQQQLSELAQEQAGIKAIVQEATPLMQNLSDQDMLTFENRRMMFGEVAAMQWVVTKYGPQ
jgi:RNA polymerase sigma factor (sigma-70 family)